MPRPKKIRNIVCNPDVSYFKPRGVPLRDLQEVGLTVDEFEAVRLADLLSMSHEEAGARMGVSRATFGRIVQKARRSIARALVNGMAIRIEGGEYRAVVEKGMVRFCRTCGSQWEIHLENAGPDDTGREIAPAPQCPRCSRGVRQEG